MRSPTLGALLYAFFEDHLKAKSGLSPATVASYRDAVRLFLQFVARDRRCRLTRVTVGDLSAQRVARFLDALETERGNHIRSRNQRLTAIKRLFDFIAGQCPEYWGEAERVAAIPAKRTPPPRTYFLAREEIEELFARMPTTGSLALRDRTLLLFLYNSGARVQEVADLRVGNLELDRRRVHLHGKGGKWRTCPLWDQTVGLLRKLLGTRTEDDREPVFTSQRGQPLTRFGIYKDRAAARPGTRHAEALVAPTADVSASDSSLDRSPSSRSRCRGQCHPNWLGHVSLETTNRYAEITLAMKEKALEACAPPLQNGGAFPARAVWRDDPSLLNWLKSL